MISSKETEWVREKDPVFQLELDAGIKLTIMKNTQHPFKIKAL